jgi:hypothetical protein
MLCVLVTPRQADAEQQIFRCVVKGKTTYSDKPCNAPASPSGPGTHNSPTNSAGGNTGSTFGSIEIDYSTPYGEWRGQAQYQASKKGEVIPAAHAVVPMVVVVEKEGKARGVSPENGCSLLGVATPFVTPTVLQLDVTLSGCRYSALNRRYTGSLALFKADNYVHLSLQSYSMGLAKPASHYDIKATMRR